MSDTSSRPTFHRLEPNDREGVEATLALKAHAFQFPRMRSDDVEAAVGRLSEPGLRVDLAREQDRPVATFASFDAQLTVPGGGFVPVDAVTWIAVLATHKRRGLLSTWMRQSVIEARDRGAVASVLTASDARIYERFGYGVATAEAESTLDVSRARFRQEPSGSVTVVRGDQAHAALAEIDTAARAAHPGTISMPDHVWRRATQLIPGRSQDDRSRWFAVHRDESGRLDGVVSYTLESEWTSGRTASTVRLHHLIASTREAERELWRYCAGIDFAARVVRSDDVPESPLPWWLDDRRAVDSGVVTDALWVRLLDVETGLSARTYDVPGRFVVQVRQDEFVGGTYELDARDGSATCRRVEPGTNEPDVDVDAAGLASLWLGGGCGVPSVDALAETGQLRARDDATARRFAAVLRTGTSPHLLMHF